MRHTTTKLLKAGGALLCAAFTALAAAQAWPVRPIRLLVGFPPGGGLDFTTRTLAPYLSKELGQPVVVDNHPGVGGVLALAEVARAAPDGYTLIVGNIGPLVLAPNMMERPPYDATKAFTSLGQVVSTSFVYTVPSNHPARNLQDFIAWAKKRGPEASFASGGTGSITHLNGELMNQWAGLQMTHVPYKGSAPALPDLVAGRTQLLVDIGPVVKPLVLDGRLKALAVSSEARDPDLPNVPTLRELGFEALETSGFQGLLGPAGLPRPIVDRLSAALAKTLAQPEVREKFAQAGTPVVARSPEEFAAFLRAENQRWAALVHRAGLRMD
jgi:tripartite-type tricarboxylate transporter receptor subunit TctC